MKKEAKKNNISSKEEIANQQLKLVVCIFTLCLVMCVLLSTYNSTVPEKLAELEAEGDMDNVIWVVTYASLVPPVIIVAIILTGFYSNKEKYVLVETQRKKALISGIVAGFTYVILLGYTLLSSPEWNLPISERENSEVTIFENTSSWFFAQIIPFAILVSYHLVRASSEKKELLENENV